MYLAIHKRRRLQTHIDRKQNIGCQGLGAGGNSELFV